MTDLLTLAQRVEGATAEEQRDWLTAAFAVCFPDAYMEGRSGLMSDWPKFAAMLEAQAWESASLMLVPRELRLRGIGEGKSGIWTADIVRRDNQRCVGIGSNRQAALAIVAAALKARASMEDKTDER